MALTFASVEIQDLTFTEKQLGLGVTVTYRNGGTAGSETVSVTDSRAITVVMQSGTSTAAQIKTAIEAHPRANELVTVTVTGTGSNAQLSCVGATMAGGAAAVKASKSFFGLYVEALTAGTAGNSIRVKFVNGSADVTVSTNDITVTFPTGAKASAVAALINADVEANLLVKASGSPADTLRTSMASDFVALAGGAAAVAPSVVVQDLTFSSDTASTLHNGATVTYTTGATAGSEVVSVSGTDVSVQIENGVSTATQIAAALNAAAAYTGAKATGVVTVVDYTLASAVAASGTVTYGTPANGDTITVNGTTFTKAAAGSATEFSTIGELEALIEALTGINASEDGTTITITAATAGAAGNAITLAKTGDHLALSGATLTGGRDATTVTVNGTALVAGVNWTPETSNNVTADNLAAAIDALAAVVAPNPAAAIITVTAANPGTAGNSIGLVTSNSSAVSVGAATLLGGTDKFAVTVSGTGATAQKTVNAAPTTGAVGEGARAYSNSQAGTALTNAFVAFNWSFPSKYFRLINDETAGTDTIAYSLDGGVTTHGTLTFGEELLLGADAPLHGIHLKYVNAAPNYRISVLG